ncbi:RWD domain-containing protein 2B [Paramyrothecium foliicola]|nr:RWD domain-containing protein 2B [Paramyrothecium foliicola]
MASHQSQHRVLPKELMELQLGQVDLLMAMYASDDAASVDDASLKLLDRLRGWCEGDEDAAPEVLDPAISMLLQLDLADADSASSARNESLQLELSVPVVHDPELAPGGDAAEPPHVKVRVRQPPWMSRAEAAALTADMPHEDMLTTIELVKEAASRHLASAREAACPPTSTSDQGSKYAGEPTIRVWFYFPSISTRSKRDDIINYAPGYGLTGFLLAGKPGILCLEGGSRAVDDYMRFIKTESWGDIPPQHKKVSERYRETVPGGLVRAFADMQEITDMVGERRGERANRGDMKAFEAWLNENGLGEAFAKILV